MRYFPYILRNFGDCKPIAKEKTLDKINFRVHKFNGRPRPKDYKKILFISAFNEFGCEMVGCLYCIPRVLQQFPGYYNIVVGWYGRSYLYKHLADEFWELPEEHQWLREYAKAFHHRSINLTRIEKSLLEIGKIVTAENLGKVAIGNTCKSCKSFWGSNKYEEFCPKCKSEDLVHSIFSDVPHWKNFARGIPRPSEAKISQANALLKTNPVGIFARGRKLYGRNLQPEFYVNLIKLLENMGYNPIWLGEKQSTMPCPVDHIVDFSRMNESKDLELTLAIISQLKFTVQFWTASTRLAAIMGVPYLLFESPDQIWGNGQEGFRRNLCSFGPSKLVVSHYKNVYNDNEAALNLVERAINEMEDDNYEDIIGLVNAEMVEKMRNKNSFRIGTEH